MAYNPGGGQPPFNPQNPYNQPMPPPPPPPSGGMSTGVKVALFGCLGIIVLGIIGVIGVAVVTVMFANKNTEVAYGNSNNANRSSSSNTNSSTKNTNSSSTPTKKSGVTIDSLELARDNNGKAGERVTTFRPKDNPMHFVVGLSEFESGTKVKVVLMAISVDTGEKNVKVGEIERETGSLENQMDATMTLPRDWPTGDYRVDVYIDGNLEKSQEFEVVE